MLPYFNENNIQDEGAIHKVLSHRGGGGKNRLILYTNSAGNVDMGEGVLKSHEVCGRTL